MAIIKKASVFFILFSYSSFFSLTAGLQNNKFEAIFNPVQLSHKNVDCNNHQPVMQSSYANPTQHHCVLMSVADFQKSFYGASEKEILSNFQLFVFENFRTYARTLSGYSDYILSLAAKIKNDKNYRKQTAYVPGFEYSFGLRGEKSGFHDFITQEARVLREQNNKKAPLIQQGALQVNDTQKLDRLAQQWSSRKSFAGDTKRLQDRLNALYKVRSTHGGELDCQLQKELGESRNVMKNLERSFAGNHHIQVLSPVVHHCAAQAAKEHCPVIAFGLSDFCHTITQMLSQGMHVLYDATYSIGKGIGKSAQAFMSIDHWKDMTTGMLQLGLLCVDAVGQEEDFHYAAALAKFSDESDVMVKFSQNYCVHTRAQKDLINRCASETYQKIKSMSWQELLENGTEIGTTMILDTLALHALSGFTKATSNAFMSQLQSITENEALFAGEYAVEVAGFGKLVVEEGAEIAVEAINNLETGSITSIVQKSGGRMMQERGKAFEDFLVQQLGGKGSFKAEGREFDGVVGNIWYEAKSGGYWNMLLSSEKKLQDFKSSIGHGLRITKENGMKFELHSNTHIPQNIKDWLTEKKISFVEWL